MRKVADSTYTVRLYFAETWFGSDGRGGPGSRIFQVRCNDRPLLRNFDTLAETGTRGRLLVKTFHGIVPDPEGHIELSFIPIVDVAAVNAIEVIDEKPMLRTAEVSSNR